MSDDEVFVLIASSVATLFGWRWLFASLQTIRKPGAPASGWLWLVPVLGGLAVWVVLETLASFDVRDAPQYQLFYVLLGLAWTSLTRAWLGLSTRDDVLERGNVAALWLYAGGVLGCAACYAGANVGDGPGWWCVVWAALLGTAGWAGTFHLLHGVTGLADHVTIDRDLASGVRAASFLVASGVMWGRGAAGDWTSAWDTALELRAAWPVVLLFVKAAWLESRLKPRPDRPVGTLYRDAVLPALGDALLVAMALVAVAPLPNAYPHGEP
jgi:hypothetical protein